MTNCLDCSIKFILTDIPGIPLIVDIPAVDGGETWTVAESPGCVVVDVVALYEESANIARWLIMSASYSSAFELVILSGIC